MATDSNTGAIRDYLFSNPNHLGTAQAVWDAWLDVKAALCGDFLEHLRTVVHGRVEKELPDIARDVRVECRYAGERGWSNFLWLYRVGWPPWENHGKKDPPYEGCTGVVVQSVRPRSNAERSGPARVHRRSNAAGILSAGCLGIDLARGPQAAVVPVEVAAVVGAREEDVEVLGVGRDVARLAAPGPVVHVHRSARDPGRAGAGVVRGVGQRRREPPRVPVRPQAERAVVLLRPADVPRDVRRRDAVVELRGGKLLVGPLAVRGQTRTSTETGEAPGWQGATRGE